MAIHENKYLSHDHYIAGLNFSKDAYNCKVSADDTNAYIDESENYSRWVKFSSENTNVFRIIKPDEAEFPRFRYSYDRINWLPISRIIADGIPFGNGADLYILAEGYIVVVNTEDTRYHIVCDDYYSISGRLNALLCQDFIIDYVEPYCFAELFSAPSELQNTINKLISCKNLELLDESGSITVGSHVYYGMFARNNSLIDLPKDLGKNAFGLGNSNVYAEMFTDCNVTDTLYIRNEPAEYWYARMFLRNLGNIEVHFSNKTAAEGSFSGMFESSNQTYVPELSAIDLSDLCYSSMFANTHIVSAPKFPAAMENYDGAARTFTAHMLRLCNNLVDIDWTFDYLCKDEFAYCDNLRYIKTHFRKFPKTVDQFYISTEYQCALDITDCVDESDMNIERNHIIPFKKDHYLKVTADSGLLKWHLCSSSELDTITDSTSPLFYISRDEKHWTIWDTGTPLDISQPLYICGWNPEGLNKVRSEDESGTTHDSTRLGYFTGSHTSNVRFSGDIMYLINNLHKIDEIPNAGCFDWLFSDPIDGSDGFMGLVEAPHLSATKLKAWCYANMFRYCKLLTAYTHDLLAIDVPPQAYHMMFESCENLSVCMQHIYGETFGYYACQGMFLKTLIKKTPILHAKILGESAFRHMFCLCSQLKEIEFPYLNLDTMGAGALYAMFYQCTKLKNGYHINVDEIFSRGCYQMYYGCSSLVDPGSISATTSQTYGFNSMYMNCVSLKYAPMLYIKDWSSLTVSSMFMGCSLLEYIETSFDTYATNTSKFTKDVAPHGIFINHGTASIPYKSNGSGDPWGTNNVVAKNWLRFTNEETCMRKVRFDIVRWEEGIPNFLYSYDAINWTHWDVIYSTEETPHLAPILFMHYLYVRRTPGTYASACYGSFDFYNYNYTREFAGHKISVLGNVMYLLNSEELLDTAGDNAFADLMSKTPIVNFPGLTATYLGRGCYKCMFYNCNNLKTAPYINSAAVFDNGYEMYYMFENCESLENANYAFDLHHNDASFAGMFKDCFKLKNVSFEISGDIGNSGCKNMFGMCESLEDARNIKILGTIIYQGGCRDMFAECSSLKYPPVLNANNIREDGYCDMFKGCKNLAESPVIKVENPETDALCGMFDLCVKLKTIHFDGIAGHLTSIYSTIFSNSVAKKGTFIFRPDCMLYKEIDTIYGTHGVPEGWTITSNGICIERFSPDLAETSWTFRIINRSGNSLKAGDSLYFSLDYNEWFEVTEFVSAGNYWYADITVHIPAHSEIDYSTFIYIKGLIDKGYITFRGYDLDKKNVTWELHGDICSLGSNDYLQDFTGLFTNNVVLNIARDAWMSKPIIAKQIFKGCSKFRSIKFAMPMHEDQCLVKEGCREMFANSSAWVVTDIMKNISEKVGCAYTAYSCESMFSECTELWIFWPSLSKHPSNDTTFGMVKSNSVRAFKNMFYQCKNFLNIATLEPTITTDNLTMPVSEDRIAAYEQFARMFYGCKTYSISIDGIEHDAYDYMSCSEMFMESNISSAPVIEPHYIGSRAFESAFNGCKNLTNISNIAFMNARLSMDGEQLSEACCMSMFKGSGVLSIGTEIPVYGYQRLFPATDQPLPMCCYTTMFSDCTLLANARAMLYSKLLSMQCYGGMFAGCTSLIHTVDNQIEMFAEKLAYYSCAYMFCGCTTITSTPKFRFTNLGPACCMYMFLDCSQLQTMYRLAPKIPTPLAYMGMFCRCTSLQSNIDAQELDDRLLLVAAIDCGISSGWQTYTEMFAMCDSLYAVSLRFDPARMTQTDDSTECMFFGCNNLHYVYIVDCDPDESWPRGTSYSIPDSAIYAKIHYKKPYE